MDMRSFFAESPEVAVAFSGGVDSAYVLYEAARWASRVRAYRVQSQLVPAFEKADAVRLADALGAELVELSLDALALPALSANGADRCYHCKRAMMAQVCAAAQADGFAVVCDGTNASDAADERPGMRALAELGVRSPLRECGLTKEMVRERSREAGLFTWDKPAYACLATRIERGEVLSSEKLARIERSEDAMRALGFVDFRVRTAGDVARLELREEDLAQVLARRTEILAALSPFFAHVTLDLEVRG